MINDYVVQWSTANRDNVAAQLMRSEINSFAIQNQASHLTSAPAGATFICHFLLRKWRNDVPEKN